MTVKAFSNSLRWANILLILATLAAYLSPFINPDAFWLFTFAGVAYPFLLLGNLFFILFWAWRRNRYFLFSLACVLAGLGYLTGFFGFHFFQNEPGKNDLKVMTYNVADLRGFESEKGEKREQKVAKLERFAEKYGQPGILCTQESKGENTISALRNAFGFTHYFKAKSTAIFSKYPFVRQDAILFENSSNSCVWADLKTPAGVVRVYSVHLQSNRMSYTANKIATEGDLREKQTWRDIRFVFSRYKQAVQVRARQARMVAKHIAQSPHPVIVCGDFNDPPVSYVYRLLSENLQDSFCEKGGGLGTTFAGRLPFLRIDYVLADERFKVLSHRVPKLELSDHLPVLVSLKIVQ